MAIFVVPELQKYGTKYFCASRQRFYTNILRSFFFSIFRASVKVFSLASVFIFCLLCLDGGVTCRDVAVDRVVRKDGRDGDLDLHAGRSGPGAESHGGACNSRPLLFVYSRGLSLDDILWLWTIPVCFYERAMVAIP